MVRAYVESEMYKSEPVRKLYYMGPMFRRERPQKGRMRQFHQIGAEALGRGDPFIDAEILLLLSDLFDAMGLTEPSLQINSLGDWECRPKYRETLLAFLKERQDSLCDNCRRRIDRNPLRALDCKDPGCIRATLDAPSILDSLCANCQEHFRTVQRLLRETNVKFILNPRMVRGLDYYCRTTFEWTTTQLGSQSAVAAGGRYDGLVQELGGPAIPGIGFAYGRRAPNHATQDPGNRRSQWPVMLRCVGRGKGAGLGLSPGSPAAAERLVRRDGSRVAKLKEPDETRR